jgi:transglutaminase-like putative cysteine protease
MGMTFKKGNGRQVHFFPLLKMFFGLAPGRTFATLLGVGCCLAVPSPALAQPSDYAIAQTPAWVTPIEAGAIDDKLLGQISDGAYFLLSDIQTHVSPEEKVTFRHFATKAINANGVETVANIEITFDPSYQQLTLHSIDVIRDGHVAHRLAGATVRVLQRETELELRIYDGSKTANVFLDDIREGDTVEYSYSLRGRNPVFGGAITGSAAMQFSVPIGRSFVRLLLPADRTISVSTRNTTQQPVVHKHDGYREYLWDSKNVPALITEKDTPGWFDPYPNAQWSEYANWAAVARWAKPLYQVPANLGPELSAEVQRIAKSETDPARRLLAALRIVQGQIRYMGVEIGPGSHAPSAPAVVFARRFGDCKDKALLLVSMLDHLGIESHPALVNTRLRRGLLIPLPAPTLFDHVVVSTRIGGRTYWLDPTRAIQKADLAHLYQPDFDYALVVDPASTALTAMKNIDAPVPKHAMHATFDARAGFEKPVHLTFVSVVDGDAAESLRNTLASSNVDDLQKKYLDYYAHYYPTIRSAAPLVVSDDTSNNRLTTTESYDIVDIASWSEVDKRHTVDIAAPDIDELARGPSSTIRQSPLRLFYPREVEQKTEVLLPSHWPVEATTTKVDDPAFTFERTVAATDKSIVINDHYASLVDEIPASDIVRYAGNLGRVRDSTGYQLHWSDSANDASAGWLQHFNWLLAVLGALVFGIWCWLAHIVYRYDPPFRPVAVDRSLQGIRGWLLLPAFGTVLTPFVYAMALVRISRVFATDTWSALTTYGNTHYHPLWAPYLLFELTAILGFLVFSVLLAITFFQRRRSAPMLFIALMIATLSYHLIDSAFASGFPVLSTKNSSVFTEIFRLVIGSVIWISYFLKSARVKSTFVMERVKHEPDTQPEAGA